MSSITDICNAALSHCGTRSKISSLDEGSPEANACVTHFAQVRDATLRGFDWNFARMTAGLAELPNPPARWRYKYALPSDCLRLRRLNDVPLLACPETFCEIAADRDSTGATIVVLFAGASPLSAIYTAQVTDPLRWDAGGAIQRPARVGQLAAHPLRLGGAGELLDQPQGAEHARGHPGGGGDLAVLDVALAAHPVHLRAAALQALEPRPVGGGPVAVEQARGGQ